MHIDIDDDRKRLGVGILAATVLHIALAIVTGFIDFSVPLPDYLGPVIVEFERIEPPQLAAVEPPPVPLPQPTPQPTAPVPQPVPTPQPATPSAPAPATPRQPAPTVPRSSQPAAPAPPAHDIPMQQWTTEDIMGGRRSGADRPRPPSPVASVDEQATAADGELPSWAAQAMADAGISTRHMDRAEVIQVAQRVQADDRFRDLLRGAISAVEAAPARSPAVAQPGTAAPATSGDTAAADLGEGMIRWAAEADRGGVPSLPQLTADMFGGAVPLRSEFIVVFDVDNRGRVVPGSIAFQTPSVYTRVNQEVRRTISGWTFQVKPGAPVESAVFTLIVYREDVL